jgi:eukaryotic-like serine/threonine-protein kinase
MTQQPAIDWNAFVGRSIGNVTIVRELGRGVMGVVFVGFQTTLKRQVAVKVLHKTRVQSALTWQMFRDEGEALAILNHPNIVPIYEMGETEDCYYQVMQLVEGYDLRTVVKRLLKHPIASKRLLPVSDAIAIVIQILDGLGFAHENGVFHQDVKPGNILIENRNKRVLVADFGIARILEAEYLSQGKIVGTPLYMSPEQALCRETDGRTDIYSMGVIFFEMLAGNLPVRDENVSQLIERKRKSPETFFIAKPSEVSCAIDTELERILFKALEPDLARRYVSCEQMLQDLKQYRRKRFPQ